MALGLPVFSLLLLVVSCSVVTSDRVLMLTVFASRSHKHLFSPVAEALAGRGHDVTLASWIKPNRVVPNLTEIVWPEFEEFFNQQKKYLLMLRNTRFTLEAAQGFGTVAQKMCPIFFEKKLVQEWVRNRPFDVVILDGVLNECLFPVAGLFGRSVMYLNTANLFPWLARGVDNPTPYAYVPFLFLRYPTHMTFTQRLYNAYTYVSYYLMEDWLVAPQLDALARRYFPQAMSTSEAKKNVSLILSNADPIFSPPRPRVPAVVDVGGLHCKPAEPLPKDLEAIAEGSGENGVIIYSLGSIHDGNRKAGNEFKLFVSVFKRLNQTVIWKYEDNVPNLPANVKTVKWLPLQDLLGHPRARAFITHSGLLSLQEAIYHGVPMVSLPLFVDQPGNVAVAEELGIAVGLDWETLNEENLYSAILKAVYDTRLRENVKKFSRIFRDRPQPPLEKAVYWTEYVMRYRGATHLRTGAGDLTFVQYFLLDVLGFLLAVVWVGLWLISRLLRFAFKSKTGNVIIHSKKVD